MLSIGGVSPSSGGSYECARSLHVAKENVKNVGKERTWTDQKRVCARPKREGWGAAQQPSSEGRERRRRRAEDVGVVLGEAACVRDVGLFHQIADVGPELRRRAARAPVLGEERRRRRQEQVVVDGRGRPRRPRARARRRRLEAGLEVRRADGVVLAREGDGQRGLVADAVEAAAQRRLDRRRRRRLGAAECCTRKTPS